jgi:hypothetical protein
METRYAETLYPARLFSGIRRRRRPVVFALAGRDAPC